jgi:KDO2-lipid IV(A) lauroyltransferase
MSTRAPVVPAFLHRDRDDPSRHVARIRPALELAQGPPEPEAVRENARRIARAIEEEIGSAPEQWTWAHRRWRTQPEGEPPPPYDLRRTIG